MLKVRNVEKHASLLLTKPIMSWGMYFFKCAPHPKTFEVKLQILTVSVFLTIEVELRS